MGLKNYQEQMNIIDRADKKVAELNEYANQMNALIISVQSAWNTNKDQGAMLNAIGDCVNLASEIYCDFNTFSINAIYTLKHMDNLEKVSKSMLPTAKRKIVPFYSNKSNSASVSKKNKIEIDTGIVDSLADQVNKYDKNLEAIRVQACGIYAQIDELIINKFSERYSMNRFNRRINNLKTMNEKVAVALKNVASEYDKVEAELKKMAEAADFSSTSSGSADGTIVREEGNTANKIDHIENKTVVDEGIVIGEYQEINGIDTNATALSQNGVRGDCNVTSQAMLLRRLLMRDGKEYQGVDQNTVRSTVAKNGQNVRYDYTYDQYRVICYQNDDASFFGGRSFASLQTSEEKSQRLQTVLSKHPEGIVVWGGRFTNSGEPHAILLTKYEDGEFYCCDPWKGANEIKLAESICTTDLSRVEQYYCSGNPQ